MNSILKEEQTEQQNGRIIIDASSIGADERIITTISTPPNGFRMPSRAAIMLHDARLSAYGSDSNVTESDEDEEQDDEDELRDCMLDKRMDSMREHSFRLPSQRSRRDIRDSLSFMGMAWGE